MTKILYPKIPRLLLQCEAERETVYANDTLDTDRQCGRKAAVEIDGKNLCMQHAGPVAVDKLIKIENNKKT